MKLRDNVRIPDFLREVQDCQGEVCFVTPEGDRLNLRSALTRFVFIAVFAGKQKYKSGDIEAADPHDQARLQAFCTENSGG